MFYQLLPTTSVRNVWKHKRRICNLILGLKGVICEDIGLLQESSPMSVVVVVVVVVASEPGPAATMVGNIVMGTRIGGAAGREIADIEEDSDLARKVSSVTVTVKTAKWTGGA